MLTKQLVTLKQETVKQPAPALGRHELALGRFIHFAPGSSYRFFSTFHFASLVFTGFTES